MLDISWTPSNNKELILPQTTDLLLMKRQTLLGDSRYVELNFKLYHIHTYLLFIACKS